MKKKRLPTLTYRHQLASGRVVTLLVRRAEDTAPRLRCNLKEQQLMADEVEEFRAWRDQLETAISEELTYGERVALAVAFMAKHRTL